MKKYQKNNDEISLKKILISFFYLLIIIIVIIFIKNNLITEIYMNIQDYKKITKLNYEIDSNAECKKYEFEGEKDIPQYYNVICGYNGSKTINNETGVILKNIKETCKIIKISFKTKKEFSYNKIIIEYINEYEEKTMNVRIDLTGEKTLFGQKVEFKEGKNQAHLLMPENINIYRKQILEIKPYDSFDNKEFELIVKSIKFCKTNETMKIDFY